MRDGFIKVAAVTPKLRVTDCRYNSEQIEDCLEECENNKVSLVVFPEFTLTGYTCSDLFLQDTLIENSWNELLSLVKKSEGRKQLVFVGLPFLFQGRLYNVAAAYCNGELLGLVPKQHIPNYGEFYEQRHFIKGPGKVRMIQVPGIEQKIAFGSKQLFECRELPGLVVGAEICEDLWVTVPPSSYHIMAGATVIVNLSASDELTGKDSYRRQLVSMQSAGGICGYLYADAGEGESTTDLVFAGHNIIAENGSILCETERFTNSMAVTELDLGRLKSERKRMTTFQADDELKEEYEYIPFSLEKTQTVLTRTFGKTPFVPGAREARDYRCNEILNIQVMGLKTRLKHIGCKKAVIGISGGLDSTLALLVTARAFDELGIDRKNILAVTMPCFGTTDRTYQNAISLTEELMATMIEVPIKEAVGVHMRDIGQDENVHDVTYENCQARMRTQVLMNLANKNGAIVIGTGDMSELALGWATYNGDHMSMYGVNASVPKTLVRYLVSYYANTVTKDRLRMVLTDILETPVSPELLPPQEGQIAQKTEELVGPYELHDFFLYYMMRFGYTPKKIYRLAMEAFEGDYEQGVILHWLKTFYRRFFGQQFKRSCLPDGPKVGSVAVSPRGDLRMPSDASVNMWMEELDSCE